MTKKPETTDRERAKYSRNFFRRWRDQETDIDDELRFHLEMEEDKLRSQGVSETEARRQARLRFGGQEKWRHEVRDIGGIGPLERLRSDLLFGLRVLRRSPVFTVVSILTLALGVGASTSIFSVVDGILLRALPYSEPEQLVTVWADTSGRGGPVREWWGYPNFYDTRQAMAASTAVPMSTEASGDRVFDELALYSDWNPTLTGTEEGALQLQGAQVSHGMLSRVLRTTPVLGESFRPSDDVPDAPRVVLISERLWRTSLGNDQEILGRSLRLNGEEFTILGVLPASFRQPLLPQADIWTTFRFSATEFPGGRGSAMFRALGRLQEDASLDLARDRVAQVAATLERDFPEDLTGVSTSVFPLKDDVVSGASKGLWLLLAAVGATLLIVCVNLANLLLARGTSRSREYSLRAALGATRGRLARQLVTESLLLSALGGLSGIALAFAGTHWLVSMAPPSTPRLDDVAVNLRVLGFAVAVSLSCGLIFGVFPALQATRTRLVERIGRHRPSAERLSEFLVAAQIAAALVILIGAGLLVQSFLHLTESRLGFRPEGLVSVFVFEPPALFSETEQAARDLDLIEEQLSTIPGVERAARVDSFPLAGFDGDLNYVIEGRDIPRPGSENIAWLRRSTPGYFATTGIELRSGRDFLATDRDTAPLVVIVNETLARLQFGGQNPVGERVNLNDPANPRWREIVGVVGDVKNFDLREDARPAMYLPFHQSPNRAAFFVLRTSGASDEIVDQVMESAKARLASHNPDLAPVIRRGESFVEDARSLDRFVTWLLTLFAGVAVLLAAVGLYGVVSYRVGQRSREIGLRLALGARAVTVGRWVIQRSLVIALAGTVVGLVAAVAAARALRSLLYEIEPTDPGTFLGLAILMIAITCLASLLPAWRAARLDPARVLKSE